MSNQSHLIFGCGLTGGFLLGVLQHLGANVKAVGRASVAERWQTGMTLSDYLENTVAIETPTFVANNDDEQFDIIWLTVKCTAIDDSLEQLKARMHERTIVVCCQNGFGSDAPLIEAFGKERIAHAIFGFNVANVDDGHMRRATEGNFVVEQALLDKHRLELNNPVMPIEISADMQASRWAKLQLNLANAINALANVPTKTMLEHRPYRMVIAAVMAELLAVTDGLGIGLPKVAAIPGHWMPAFMRLPDWLYRRVAQSMLAIDPTAMTSMWWDIKNQRPTEIDFLNGAVVAAARGLNISTPANDILIELIKQCERGELDRSWSAEEFAARFGL